MTATSRSDLEDDVRKPAQELLEQAQARMGKIRVLIHGPSEGLSVLVDGSVWPTAAIGSSNMTRSFEYDSASSKQAIAEPTAPQEIP